MHVIVVIEPREDMPNVVATFGLFRNTHAADAWLWPDGRGKAPNRKVADYVERGYTVSVTPIMAPGTNKPLMRPLR